MAAIHHALQTLAPTSFSDVPLDESELSTYLQEAFARCQALVDSVPPPPIDASVASARSRANTATSIASNISEVSSSSARSEAPIPEHEILQKEWGKPIKLSAKDNPMGMGVYKLSSKDGRGAWFARRSVHEGLPFSQWKDGLQGEFPESMKVQGGPGEGNIRGIGGERLVARKAIEGVGKMEVYHLSAKFPGPTTPRDFITLLLTSSSALTNPSPVSASTVLNPRGNLPTFTEHPRHFMVISKPCKHPDCPPRDGFIRGEYESIEFVREIPKTSNKSSSTTDLPRSRRLSDVSPSIDKEAILRHARQQSADLVATEGRARGKTISFAESKGSKANGESMGRHQEMEDDVYPVEWIMITRSDPGGSVPRFMVERGTPAGIVSDAGKFIDWACKRGNRSESFDAEENHSEAAELQVTNPPSTSNKDPEEIIMNRQLTGLDGTAEYPGPSLQSSATIQTPTSAQGNGLFSSLANSAYSSIEAYAPQVVIDRLPIHNSLSSTTGNQTVQIGDPFIADPVTPIKEQSTLSPTSSTTSLATFASADSHLSTSPDSLKSTNGAASTSSPKVSSHEREFAKLTARKQLLDAKLSKIRERETKNKEELTSKETQRLRKAEEKHAREIHKAEEKHEKELKALEAKRKREEIKSEEKMKRALDKDDKARLTREKEELRLELEMTKREKDILMEHVGELQRENTVLVARLGKLEDGGKILKEVKDDLTSGSRSRSSSLRRMKEKGGGSTIGVGEALGGAVGTAVLIGGPNGVKDDH